MCGAAEGSYVKQGVSLDSHSVAFFPGRASSADAHDRFLPSTDSYFVEII